LATTASIVIPATVNTQAERPREKRGAIGITTGARLRSRMCSNPRRVKRGGKNLNCDMTPVFSRSSATKVGGFVDDLSETSTSDLKSN
jgi:hypothetical protein